MLSPSHSVPLLMAAFSTGLSLSVLPASQVVEQLGHSPHSPQTHGHGWVSNLKSISSISSLFSISSSFSSQAVLLAFSTYS